MKKRMTFGGLIICFGNLCFFIHSAENRGSLPISIDFSQRRQFGEMDVRLGSVSADSGVSSRNSSVVFLSPLVSRANRGHSRTSSLGDRTLSNTDMDTLSGRTTSDEGINDGHAAECSDTENLMFPYESFDSGDGPDAMPMQHDGNKNQGRFIEAREQCRKRLKTEWSEHLFEELRDRVKQRDQIHYLSPEKVEKIWERPCVQNICDSLSPQQWMAEGAKFNYCRQNKPFSFFPISESDGEFIKTFKALYCDYVLIRDAYELEKLEKQLEELQITEVSLENRKKELKSYKLPYIIAGWIRKVETFRASFDGERKRLLHEAKKLDEMERTKQSDQKMILIEVMAVLRSDFGKMPSRNSYVDLLAKEAEARREAIASRETERNKKEVLQAFSLKKH